MDEMTVVHLLELAVLPPPQAGTTIPVRLKRPLSRTCGTRDCCGQNPNAQPSSCRTVAAQWTSQWTSLYLTLHNSAGISCTLGLTCSGHAIAGTYF